MNHLNQQLNIHIISAGAGTGKTQRLADILAQKIDAGEVQPEKVVATTFTNKAAAELEERVRQTLVSANKLEAARRLRAARIGTVNSVCGRLLQEWWHQLGISPEVRVVEETESAQILRETLSTVIQEEEMAELALLGERLSMYTADGGEGQKDKWPRLINDIVGFAQQNAMTAENLADFAQKSWGEYDALLRDLVQQKKLQEDCFNLTAFAQAVKELEDALAREPKPLEKTLEFLQNAQRILQVWQAGHIASWNRWADLAAEDYGTNISEKVARAADKVQYIARCHIACPDLHQDLQRAIALVFELAARVMRAYEERKRQLGVIDFRDQEALALQLLEKPEVVEQLREEIQLVLVDEFQDTSPIQLAIFLKLAEIAPQSYWIGDRKQAIYGFRGTDPVLMEAVIQEIISSGGTPEILKLSYRSRPKLVCLTSKLFVPAFSQYGFAADEVKLKPATDTEPAGLGPIVEYWNLCKPEKTKKMRLAQMSVAIAEGVRQLLEGPEAAQVRDPVSGEARPARPGDIAILCRTHSECALVAAALQARGLPAAYTAGDVILTPEGQAALAAFALWINPNDSLARAQLLRLAQFPADGSSWLQQLLQESGAAALEGQSPIAEVLQARQNNPQGILCGPLRALDLALEAAGIRELCLRWGEANLRLDNIERLRAQAAAYVHACETRGESCSPARLLSYLWSGLSQTASPAEAPTLEDAVVVSTMHGAKGLEWPLVVLALLSDSIENKLWDVQLRSETDTVNLQNPLENRLIRFLPYPYADQRTRSDLHHFVQTRPEAQQAKTRQQAEQLRLAYMAWTRARDRVIVAVEKEKLATLTHCFQAVRDPASSELMIAPERVRCLCAKLSAEVLERELECQLQEEDAGAAEPQSAASRYVATGPQAYPPAVVQASELVQTGVVLEVLSLHEYSGIVGHPNEQAFRALGEAVHGFLAADHPSWSAEQRELLAQEILKRWGVEDYLEAEKLRQFSDSLHQWIQQQYPGAQIFREWPLSYRQENGTLVVGTADLVLQTPTEIVVIDYKTFPGGYPQALQEVPQYGGQLQAYATALQHLYPDKAIHTYIYLPVSGKLFKLARETSA